MPGPATGPRRRGSSRTGPLAEVGRLVRERRLTLGLTQSDLADLAGVGLSSVRGVEAGLASTTLSVVLAVLDATGLAMSVGPVTDLQSTPHAVLLSPGDGRA